MLRPMGARALVKRMDEPKPQSSLIVIPESAVDKPSQYAVVLAVGRLQQGGFEPGDVVILKDFAGAPCSVVLDGEEVEAAIVVEDDVLAVAEET